MAIKQFAIPVDETSDESGDISFKELAVANTDAEFQLTNVTSGTTVCQLNLITKKNGVVTHHIFTVAVASGTAKVTLSHSDLSSVYNDANGGSRDYVEAKWTLQQVDTPSKSNQYIVQSNQTYNMYKWPPNHPDN